MTGYGGLESRVGACSLFTRSAVDEAVVEATSSSVAAVEPDLVLVAGDDVLSSLARRLETTFASVFMGPGLGLAVMFQDR